MTDKKRYVAYEPDTGKISGFYSEGRKGMPDNVVEVTLEDINEVNKNQFTHVAIKDEISLEGDLTGSVVFDHFYKVVLEPTTEELHQQFKAARTKAVEELTVTVDDMVFDADEVSQGRLSRAIVSLDPLETTLWVLNDNEVAYPTREQLKMALRLAGQAQTNIWVEE